MRSFSPKLFDEAALAACLIALRENARVAVNELMPFIDQKHRTSLRRNEILEKGVFIPSVEAEIAALFRLICSFVPAGYLI